MVAKALGEFEWNLEVKKFRMLQAEGTLTYSTDWFRGGAIIEREKIGTVPMAEGWQAQFEDERIGQVSYGPTLLIAAMRCFVASRLGDEVEVPDELA